VIEDIPYLIFVDNTDNIISRARFLLVW